MKTLLIIHLFISVIFIDVNHTFHSSNEANKQSVCLSNSYECPCNNPCTSLTWNSSTECVSFAETGSNCSPIATSVTQWKDDFGTYTNIPSSNELCGCNVYEYLDVIPVCSVNNGKFVIGGDQITRCANRCLSRVDFTFPMGVSNLNSFPACSQTVQCIEISPADLLASGGAMTAYFRSDTPSGTVVSIIRFTYNGNGLNCNNINSQIIQTGKIYKDIWVKRTVNYSDGCDPTTCEFELNIPQQDDECLLELFVNTVNVGAPCNFIGFGASTINAVAPNTYQWTYNGNNIPQNYTPNIYCLSGKPFGTYCVNVTDSDGCVSEACRIYQTGCTLGAMVINNANILSTSLTNCSGSPTYKWSKWSGNAWVTVGNSATYNTGGAGGNYRVTVVCGTCTAIGSYILISPCSASVSIVSSSSDLTAFVTGCSGSILYQWERQVSTYTWQIVQTTNSSFSSNVYSPSIPGNYKIKIFCGSCTSEMQTSWTDAPPIFLPIKLISFDAVNTQCGKISLTWETENEVKNEFIELLKSDNGIKYVSIARFDGKKSRTKFQYKYTDQEGLKNGSTYYYKLIQVDLDGKVSEFNPVSCIHKCNNEQSPELLIFPNPVHRLLNINVIGLEDGETFKINIKNAIGINIFQNHYSKTIEPITIDLEALQSGIYFVELQVGQQAIVKRFIKIH